jgi:predicted nucleic acid-binding protein
MPARGRPFFDTNVLIYLASGDEAKADRAEALVATGGVISVQVLNELLNVARRKMRLSWSDARAVLETVRGLLSVEAVTVAIHESAVALAERYNLAIYDSVIVASALAANCETLWSEDMQHGLLIEDRLRILNPFHPQ